MVGPAEDGRVVGLAEEGNVVGKEEGTVEGDRIITVTDPEFVEIADCVEGAAVPIILPIMVGLAVGTAVVIFEAA